MSKKRKEYGKFRWCLPRVNVYRPATNESPPRVTLNRYSWPEPTVIGVDVGLFGRRVGVRWKRG